jgi:hypothetical protein
MSLVLTLAFVFVSGSLTWIRRPRLASLASSVKVETDHPRVICVAGATPGLYRSAVTTD